MNLIWTAIVGLIAGALAKLIMPGKDPGGIWITMALGVAGAFVANFLGGALGWYGANHSAGIIGSTVGAILILLVYRMIKGKAAKSPA
jgi:uncharacterized membrane protein YeaQ/YmgE (transglycosylase-associated protein family)